jgi:glutathione S-transferase
MAIELYWFSGSPFAWRVMLALEVKGLRYQSHLLEMSKGEHKTAEYLALNPRGMVPTLRDGAVVVRESVAMLAYLDRRYPEEPLFGRTAEEAALIWQEIMECTSYIERFDDFILPIYRGQADKDDKDDKDQQVRAVIPLIDRELDRLERTLARSPWLAGAALSAADLSVYPFVRSLVRAAEKPAAARFEHGFLPIARRRPAVAAWMAAIEALPGYDRTFPPHWRAAHPS